MVSSTHPGSLQFQPFDSQYPLLATALAGGIASVAVAFAHTPTIKYFEAGMKAPSNFASPTIEASQKGDRKHAPSANLAQVIDAKPEMPASAKARLATIQSTAPASANIHNQPGHVQPAAPLDPHPTGVKKLAIAFALPPVSRPVGTVGKATPIAPDDHAVIAYTLPDLPKRRESARTPGTAASAAQPIAVADGLDPLFGGPGSAIPVEALEVASDNVELANASYSTQGAMPDHLGQTRRLASPQTAEVQRPLMNTTDAVAKFDLAAVPRTAATAAGRLPDQTANLAETTAQDPRGKALRYAGAAPSRDRIVNGAIMHDTSVSVNNHIAGRLSVRIDASGGLAIRLGDLLAMVRNEMAPSAYSRLAGATAANDYLSFAALRDAGIDLRYDAGNDLLVISGQS